MRRSEPSTRRCERCDQLEAQLHQLRTRSNLAEVLNSIVQCTEVMLAYLDGQFNFVAVNRAYAEGSRKTTEELIGRNHFDLFPHAENEAIFRRVRDTGEPASFRDKPFELPGESEGGVSYWDWTLTPVTDGDRNVAGLVLSVQETTDRKRAEETLRTVALFPEQNRAPVLRVSREGELLYANPASEPLLAFWGCDLGRRVPEPIFSAVRDALERGEASEVENTVNGAIYSFSVAPIGSEGYANLYGRDVTDHKRAEEALEQRNAFLHTILESLTHPFYVVDIATHEIVMANAATGLAAGSSKPKCHLVAHGHDEPCSGHECSCPLSEVTATRKPTKVEHIHRGADGRSRYIEVHGYPLCDTQGNVTQMIEYCLDVTERREAEQTLRASEEKFRSLFATMNEAFVVLEAVLDDGGEVCDWRVLDANPAVEQMTGIEPADVVGHTVRELFPEIDSSWFDTCVQVEATGRSVGFERRFEPLSRDYYACVYRPAPGQVAIVFVDITERKRNEQENKRNEARLESLMRISQHRGESVADLFDLALAEAIALTSSKIGYIYSYDEASKEFTLCTWSKEVMELCRVAQPQKIYQLDQTGIWGEAVRQARPIVINDFLAHHPQKKGYPQGHVPISTYLTIPVKSDDRIVAVIGVANKEGRYDDSDIRQLTLLMDSVWKIVERERAEESLRASEQRYRSLFNGMTEGFALHEIICDAEGRAQDYRFLDINPAFEQLTGLDRKDVVGRLVSEVLPGEASQWIDRYLPVVMQGQSIHFEEYSPGLGKHFEVFAYSPSPGQFAVLFLDITDRMQIQKDLQQANAKLQEQTQALQLQTQELATANGDLSTGEQRLRLALEGGRMAYWERDCRDGASVWSEMLYTMLGLDPAQTTASTETLLLGVHPDDRDGLWRLVREAEAKGTDFEAEFRIVRPDDQVVWVLSRGKVIRDSHGQAIRMMGVVFDISQRRQMEAELRRLNERLEEKVLARTDELAQTIETLRDEVALRCRAEDALRERSRILEGFFQYTITPLAILDKQFRFLRVNGAFAEAAGRRAETFVGESFLEFYPSDQYRSIFEQVVQAKETYHAYAKPFDFRRATETGPSWWNWLLTPLLDEFGHVELLVFNLEDVTERQLAFEELETRASQLQRLTLELSEAEDRERQRLAEVLHDDLQQLLVGAKLHLNILANQIGGDEELDQIVGQIRTLIGDAINRSRGLSHELSPPLLQQGGLVEVLNWLGQQMFSTCGLTVEVDAKSDVNFHSDALRTFAYRAVQEMLFNVVKHARVKRAKVELRRIAGYVRLMVSDEGQGFDPQQLTERTRTGFGLFSIQERVQLLGGWMKFRSTPGNGSVFVLAIPDRDERDVGVGEASPGNTETDTNPVLPAAHRRGDKRLIRVLLVDDHKVMRQGIATLLDEEPDMEVVGQAGNGRDAVTLAEQLQPDVIVMDVAMPVLAGDEATRQIKSQSPAVRVIVLSASEPGAISDRMMRAGAEIFIRKTDPSERLLEAIRGGHPTS